MGFSKISSQRQGGDGTAVTAGSLLVEVCDRAFTKWNGFLTNIGDSFRKPVALFIFSGICTGCGGIITRDETYSHQVGFSCPNNCGFQALPENLKQQYKGYPGVLGGDLS